MKIFTKYAEQKFDILNKHKIYFTREQIENAIDAPNNIINKGKYTFIEKDSFKVVYQKQGSQIKIITFYPIKTSDS